MPGNDEYVKRHEWVQSRGDLYNKIQEIDAKHDRNYSKANSRVDKVEIFQEQAINALKEQTEELKTMNKNFSNVSSRVSELEFESKELKYDLGSVQTVIDEKSKGNVQIITALIGCVGTVAVAIIGLAHYFF